MKWQSCLAISVLSLFISLPAHSAETTETTDQQALHVLNRLGYGPKPGDIERIKQLGIAPYIEAQLHPETIPLPSVLTQRLKSLDVTDKEAGEALLELFVVSSSSKPDDKAASKKRRVSMDRIVERTAEARIVRAIDSPRQLEEVMVDFWFNHFNVFSGKSHALVASYERDAIRPYVLGSFRQLLGATAKHPAMLFYLDNWRSTSAYYVAPATGTSTEDSTLITSGLNDSYASALMAVHTLGMHARYPKEDVPELARMFTGWTFDPNALTSNNSTFKFDPQRHDIGGKNWLGRHISGIGQPEGEMALDILATHRTTAHHLSFKLAQYFVQDAPPPALVSRLAKRYLETRGDIRSVLQALFTSPEFMAPSNVSAKFKSPYRFVISAARATGMSTANVRPLLDALNDLDMPLYGCPTPDGYKNTEAAWSNPDSLKRRLAFATAFAAAGSPIAETVKGTQETQNDNPYADLLLETLGPSISDSTRELMEKNAVSLRAATLLGSTDFMRH